ncbi:hypothetical protein Tco_0360561 [Tanacetum coccineum]
MDEDQAGPDPVESRVALAGSDPEPTHDEFMANVYPNVHESLKFPADEHVILEDPLSSTGTLSSMKNLEDAYTIGDQFLNDKSTEDEPGKLNVQAEVVSMFTILIYQASSSVPPLSTPQTIILYTYNINLVDAFLYLSSTSFHYNKSTTDVEFAARVNHLTEISSIELKRKLLDNTTQNLGSRVFTLELQDLPHKIDEAVRDAVKEASGTYKSLPEHIALYEALEASIEWVNKDEFFAEQDKSRNSSKQQSGPHSEQLVEDVPMPDTTHLSNSEETDSAYLLKIKPRLEWLKPIPEEDRPKTPKPYWSVPSNDLPELENN